MISNFEHEYIHAMLTKRGETDSIETRVIAYHDALKQEHWFYEHGDWPAPSIREGKRVAWANDGRKNYGAFLEQYEVELAAQREELQRQWRAQDAEQEALAEAAELARNAD